MLLDVSAGQIFPNDADEGGRRNDLEFGSLFLRGVLHALSMMMMVYNVSGKSFLGKTPRPRLSDIGNDSASTTSLKLFENQAITLAYHLNSLYLKHYNNLNVCY